MVISYDCHTAVSNPDGGYHQRTAEYPSLLSVPSRRTSARHSKSVQQGNVPESSRLLLRRPPR
ncbi:hypothetical protein OESDEN_00305 [Oesophagostomum dentatum]|uniref:Uncharacterized protein n=1 Tax=Oesophagostomum dentatum TaxID=61180 RepID=A0A0B1TQA6_OESDE|nr:hypothetical protein OESDEN_00305 [Oesophagostomum dentatum]